MTGIHEQLKKIIIDDDIEELKKLFCNQYIIYNYVDWSLFESSIQGKLNIVKYILKNYSSKIAYDSIKFSLYYTTTSSSPNHLIITKYIKLYKIIKNNTVIYKKNSNL